MTESNSSAAAFDSSGSDLIKESRSMLPEARTLIGNAHGTDRLSQLITFGIDEFYREAPPRVD